MKAHFLRGSSRWVFVIGGYAFKIPSLNSYQKFLYGLIANDTERKNYFEFYEVYPRNKLCPIVMYLPLGLLNVMKEATIMTEAEFTAFDYSGFVSLDNCCILPVERKADSFGYYKDQIVAIDYH